MMRILLLAALLVAYAKPKKETAPPVEAPPPVAAPAPAPAPEPVEEAPPAAPARVKNADLSVTMVRADGSSKSLKVTGVERSIDFYADQGWSSEDKDLRISMESGTTERAVAWKDVKSISITPGKIPDDLDCTYSSDFTPWMYECTIRTTANIVLKDGSKGTVNNRHMWRFTTEDGASAEFWLFKHTARQQEDAVDGSLDAEENTGMYPKLQEQLRNELKSTIVKSITIQ